jgi:hypothetical protein
MLQIDEFAGLQTPRPTLPTIWYVIGRARTSSTITTISARCSADAH